MPQVKKRIFAGDTCDQIVYSITDADEAKGRTGKPRVRFNNEQERAEFNDRRGLRRFTRQINENFSTSSFYGTLTFDDENEVHTFEDAKRIRANFKRALLRKCPDAKIVIVMGRGKNTSRIHFHFIIDGIDAEAIAKMWKYGGVIHITQLRAHNYYNGTDYGKDYSSLAAYLWGHWTPEQGRYHYVHSNLTQPEERGEKEKVCKRTYRPDRPPKAPKGFKLREVTYNKYGYICFHYTKETDAERRKREKEKKQKE